MKFPRWLSLLFIAAIGYMVYQAGREARVEEPLTPAIVNERAYPEIGKLTDAEYWKKSLDPEYAKAMQACAPVEPAEGMLGVKVSVGLIGEGIGAKCGEEVEFHLTRWNNQGGYDDETDVTLILGQSGIPGLDSALMELKPGGERIVLIPASSTKTASPLRPFIPANKLSVITFSRPAPEAEETPTE